MYPHERSLVEKYKQRPFAILGVNSDRDRAKLKQRMAKEQITWKSFFDGGTGGPIATRWNVQGWPTLYLLDAKGVIRLKNVRGKRLEEAIEKLVQEAEGGAGASSN